jgi:RHS repeat-associated protein
MTVGTPPTALASYSYTLGAAGNRTAVTELGGRTINYTYDDLYRLTSESIANDPHGINGSASYSYDPVGNRLNRSSSIAPVTPQSSMYDLNDRLTSDGYDNNGNTTATNGNSYGYDFENHITSLNGGTVRYVYDGDGNRVGKTVGGVTTNYLVDTNNPTGYAQVVEELQGGVVVEQFNYGHDLISRHCPVTSAYPLSFYRYDGHGSVRLLTNASGAITDAYDYDAFGNLIYHSGTTPNDYLYSGEQFDANLGFYYLRARYMNTSSGRFLTSDAFEGNNDEPKSLHKYLYAYANPISNTDPSGRFSVSVAEITSVQLANAVVQSISLLTLLVIKTKIEEKLEEYRCGQGGGVALYRSMKRDFWTGKPLVEQSARGLGVRDSGPNPDITPDENGNVHPNSGGMSVAPITPMSLPPHRRPFEFGGSGSDPVWCISSIWIEANSRLQFRQDSLTHGNIEPNARMPLEDYRVALSETQFLWTHVKSGLF